MGAMAEKEFRQLLERVIKAGIVQGCKVPHPRIDLVYDIQAALEKHKPVPQEAQMSIHPDIMKFDNVGEPGDVCVLSAPTKSGKTEWLVNGGHKAMQANKFVIHIGLENDIEHVYGRYVRRNGPLTSHEQALLIPVHPRGEGPLTFDGYDLIHKIWSHRIKDSYSRSVELIILDYFDLMADDPGLREKLVEHASKHKYVLLTVRQTPRQVTQPSFCKWVAK